MHCVGGNYAQNPVTCYLCGDYAANRCSVCNVHICRKCRITHRQTHQQKGHRISLIVDTCKTHAGEKYHFCCEKCKTPVCNKCVIEKHKGHPFCEINKHYKEQKEKLSKYIKLLKQERIPQYKRCISNIQNEMHLHNKEIDKIKQEMAEQTRNIIHEINQIFRENFQELTFIQDHNMKYYQEKEHDMSEALSELQVSVKLHEESLDVCDEISLLLYTNEEVNYDGGNPPDLQKLSPPSYDRGKIEDLKSCLVPYFGDLKVSPNPKRILMETPHCTNSFSMNFPVSSVCCTEPSKAWLNTFNPRSSRQIGNFFTNDGKKKKEITFRRNVYDMAVSNLGRIVFSDRNGKCIIEITSSRQQDEIIKMTQHPQGICFLRSGELMVCAEASESEKAKVIRYDDEGKIVKKYVKDNSNYLFSNPAFITEASSGNLWVSDQEKLEVLVLDRNGMLQFTYCERKPKRFLPDRIKADKLGNIFLADKGDSKIHIINENGVLMSYLTFGQSSIFTSAFDVDGMGKIWLAHADLAAEEFDVFGDTSIYEVQYLQ